MFTLTDNHEFVIENFQEFHPFSSFLPGIVGEDGIPLWAFYINRGQAMAGFGIRDKDSAITEFFPADKSYQMVPVQGFRTFVKMIDGDDISVFEPFSIIRDHETVQETLTIGMNHIELNYRNEKRGLVLTVEYSILPHAPLAGLVRDVSLKNTSGKTLDIELIDGLATILPSGLNNAAYKELGNTLKSWFDVETINNQFNFYHLRGSTEDTANVSEIHDGNFYASLIVFDNDKDEIVEPIYDRALIFGNDLTLQHPVHFQQNPLARLQKQGQISTNKVSCGFTPVATKLHPEESVRIVTLIGYAESRGIIQEFICDKFTSKDMLEYKRQAKSIVHKLTDHVKTETAEPLFDAYVKQNYLDNGLRGGFPYFFKHKDRHHVFYLYSRKHGDLERDYNFFTISPTYYSQGNGNYRDINQNRRLDVLFHPQIKDYNIKHFINLIQLDGYNPLVIKEVQYTIQDIDIDFSVYGLTSLQAEKLRKRLMEPFAPGDIFKFIMQEEVELNLPFEQLLTEILSVAEESLAAEHGEGFWIDHWTYNLDLIDSYLAVYPDKTDDLFFGTKYRFFDSPAYVKPRDQKYVHTEGKLRQYEAVAIDEAKQQSLMTTGDLWVRSQYGNGKIYETNLFSKLMLLAAIKTATIAPFGLGIEMEADKPGWNDALNGLPGMLGASTSELYELKRLLMLLEEVGRVYDGKIIFPMEARNLIVPLAEKIRFSVQTNEEDSLTYWKEVSEMREAYREAIRHGISGENFELSTEKALELLRVYRGRVERALKQVETYNENGLVPTYFYFEATSESDAPSAISQFQPRAVAPFLEGVVKKMKLSERKEEAEAIYRAVKNSDIFDEKLGMYKTSMSIAEEPTELGRAKFFTPGWLENESIFMHMEYKYLLEVLKQGLAEPFFQDIRIALVPFLDPSRYGRSILENSSFIASSANPDPQLHGRGFVARLSGSTVEFLNMWMLMFIGKRPFTYDWENRKLEFRLQPTLPSWLFKEDGTVSFTLFGQIKVIYQNERRKATFGEEGAVPVKYTIIDRDGNEQVISAPTITGAKAFDIRNGKVAKMMVELE